MRRVVPEKVILHLRHIDESGRKAWLKLALGEDELERRARFHPSSTVDVALLNITDRLVAELESGKRLAQPYFLGADHHPSPDGITVEVGDDVLVAGYPRGFYDEVNLFPIVKAGIIASRWGAYFQGHPYFLIDAKLFPGSSGSVVVSKPIDFMVKGGKIMHSKDKQFALLGIFSGGPALQEDPVRIGDFTITRTSGFNLGIVWYAQAIEEARINGLGLRDALKGDGQSNSARE